MPSVTLNRDLGGHVQVRTWRHADGATDFLPTGAHPALEIAWVDEGGARYRVGSAPFHLVPGTIAVVPQGAEHRTAFDEGSRCSAILVSERVVAEIADAMGHASSARSMRAGLVDGGARALRLAALLREEAESPLDGSLLASQSIVEALVVELLRREPPRARTIGGARDPRIRAALDKMHAAYAEPISVEDLASAAGMSRFHFSRLFREQVGEAPYRHLQRIRVRRAAELLQGGRYGVTEAALSVGFVDLPRFARAFRAEMGVSPGELRRARIA